MSQRPQGTHVPAVRAETEKNLGITQRSATIDFAWTGDIRKRYTDFLVNEIRKDGTVLHLRDFEEDPLPPPSQTSNERKASGPNSQADNKPKVISISEDDRKIVVDLLGEAVAQKLVELDENVQAKKPLTHKDRTVEFDPVTDRTKRGTIHQEIRRIFRSRIETAADAVGVIHATPTKWALNSRSSHQNLNNRSSHQNLNSRASHPNLDWSARRDNQRQSRDFSNSDKYLHFTLYKENKDTMDAVNTIARLLKVKASNFGFAGTKDRRAATVQRISVYHQRPTNLIWLNSRIPNIKVGDFEFSKDPLQLGQHGGNEFIITLKNCEVLGDANGTLVQRMKMIQQTVESGLAYLRDHGYINYYGLQRFGTYTIGTHLLGMKILKGDYEGFINDILHVDDDLITEVLSNATPPPPPVFGPAKDQQNNRDDQNRARAITTWKTTKNASKALEFMPKRFSSEAAIIRHLGKNQKDFTGAVLSITRGMRMMYVHAYQSYVWNFVATRRWAKYGAQVVEGDLVLVEGSRRRDHSDDEEVNPYDDNDDDNDYAQARPLSAAEAASGKYTIFDIVLPTPGFDVTYPRNEIGAYYSEFMAKPENGALNPFDMRRKQREFSLSGNYRTLVGRLIGDPQFAVKAYRDDTQQMYPTDLDYALHKKKAEAQAKAQARAAAEAKREPAGRAVSDPTLNRWTHFAQNPAAYDNAMAAERRRKADEELPAPAVVVTNETWVQTGVDGSAKRVKLTRHHQQIETQKTTSADQQAKTQEAPYVPQDAGAMEGLLSKLTRMPDYPVFLLNQAVALLEAPAIKTPSPAGKGTSVAEDSPNDPEKTPTQKSHNGKSQTEETSAKKPQVEEPPQTEEPRIQEPQFEFPSVIFNDGPFPEMPLPADYLSKSKRRGVAELYYAEHGRLPYYGPLPWGFAMVNGGRLFKSQVPSWAEPPEDTQDTATEQANGAEDSAADQAKGTEDAAADQTNGVNPEGQKPPTEDAAAPATSTTPAEKQGATKATEGVEWYGNNLPKLPDAESKTEPAPAHGDSMALVKVEEPDSPTSPVELVNYVAVPNLRTASSDSSASEDGGIDEASIDRRADKIAVILKFQLKASNYATIVLRELMGTTADE